MVPLLNWLMETKFWYLKGKLHREDGPAVEWADGDKFWYLNGEEVTEEEVMGNKERENMNNQRTLPLVQPVSEMVRDYGFLSKQPPSPSLYEDLIEEEYGEFRKSRVAADKLKELSDLVYVIYGYARDKGWDLDEAVRRVHENNIGRMYQEDGNILRRDDGKIIKNKSYPKVYLEDLVKEMIEDKDVHIQVYSESDGHSNQVLNPEGDQCTFLENIGTITTWI